MSSEKGSGHWWAQRLTAVALLFLGLWFLISIVTLGNLHYDAATAWMSQPLNSILMLLTFAALVYHSKLGVQIVIDDYVHGQTINPVSLRLNVVVHFLLAAAGIYAILNIGFGS